MEKNCKNCRFFKNPCSCIVPFPEVGCSNFKLRSRKYVLVHTYLDTNHHSIIAFDDDYYVLYDIMLSHYRYCSKRHKFTIQPNTPSFSLKDIKDECLINVCKNVAQYLDIGVFAMLNKSYSKASAWFEKAKDSASLGANIIDNY